MTKFEKEEEKRVMLRIIKDNCWDMDINENSSYDEVKEIYDEMTEEFDAVENDMFPNGRDYDAENFDN